MIPAMRGVWRRLVGDTWVFDPPGAGARILALGAALGLSLGSPTELAGLLAAGGAFTVGFGAPLGLRGSRSLLLLTATAGIGACAILGSLAAEQPLAATSFAALLGWACGRAASRGAGLAWVALQCALAGVIATGFPASLAPATGRALAIVAGGLLQTVVAFAYFSGRPPPESPAAEPFVLRHEVHLALALPAAMAIAKAFALKNGYWAPMTALLVLRPGGQQTMARAIARVVGTVGGAGLASAVLVGFHPGRVWLGALVAAAAFAAYLFQKATYGLLSACVTAYVVFVFAFGGHSEERVALARVVATSVGGAVSLAVVGIDRGLRRRTVHATPVVSAGPREETSPVTLEQPR